MLSILAVERLGTQFENTGTHSMPQYRKDLLWPVWLMIVMIEYLALTIISFITDTDVPPAPCLHCKPFVPGLIAHHV